MGSSSRSAAAQPESLEDLIRRVVREEARAMYRRQLEKVRRRQRELPEEIEEDDPFTLNELGLDPEEDEDY